LTNMEGEEYIRGTNGRYLKKYYHVERGSIICVTSSHFSKINWWYNTWRRLFTPKNIYHVIGN